MGFNSGFKGLMTNGTRSGWGVSVTPRPLFTPEKDPVPILQKAEWDPGPVWKGAENLAPDGIRYPDRPARSQSLYRLRYPAHVGINIELHNYFRCAIICFYPDNLLPRINTYM